MEFGSLIEIPPAQTGSPSTAFDRAVEEVEAADRLGLDVVWLTELHGDPERSLLSAPMMVASAIAARTTRIKIGIAVQLVPLAHPLRLAEEAATVDQISRGRLIYGVGRGGVVSNYDDYGIDYGESRARLAESIEILGLAWTQSAFSYEGKHHRFSNVTVTPKPHQKPYPELRVAVASPETFLEIGRLGLPIFISAWQRPLVQFVEPVNAYRAAYAAAGHPGRGRVFLRIPAYLAETRERARAEAKENLMQRLRSDEQFEALLETQAIIDEPHGFAARLREVEEQIGLDGILAELNCAGKIPQSRVLNALRLLCEEVKPQFH